jgi:hypothetical protein
LIDHSVRARHGRVDIRQPPGSLRGESQLTQLYQRAGMNLDVATQPFGV